MVYTPGNEVCSCLPTDRQRSLRRAPQVKSDITGSSSHSFPHISGVISDVFEVTLAELYLLPGKSCVTRVSSLHLNDSPRTPKVSHHSGAHLHHTVADFRRLRSSDNRRCQIRAVSGFFKRAAHSLQSSQAPKIHLLSTRAG